MTRRPDQTSEARLDALRKEAEQHGVVRGAGVRPGGSPLPDPAGAESYYGLPLLKRPVWTWEVPLYFFVGGVGGASACIALTARVAPGSSALRADARRLAVAAAALSAPLLIMDLGRPERFLNMLRVFKPQSPMSAGAWLLSAFGACSLAALLLPERARIAAEVPAAISGAGMATYTGVLLGATAIPLWSHHAALLPVHFGASSLAASASLLEWRGHASPALHWLALSGAAYESLVSLRMERSRDVPSRPLREGASGTLTRTAAWLSGPIPLLARLIGTRSPRMRRLAAASAIAGSLLTRFAWVSAGKASADDPRVPLQSDRDHARRGETVGEGAPGGEQRQHQAQPAAQQRKT